MSDQMTLADFVRQAARHVINSEEPLTLRMAHFASAFPDDFIEMDRKATHSYIRNTINRMPEVSDAGLKCKVTAAKDDGAKVRKIELVKGEVEKRITKYSVTSAERRGYLAALRDLENFSPDVASLDAESFPAFQLAIKQYRHQCDKLRKAYAPEQESESESD